MDPSNPIVQLCAQGAQAEFEKRPADAHRLYQQAWDTATDDYEASIAAHYLARFQPTPTDALHWNQIALDRANLVPDDRVKDFYPSLYVNLGRSYELLGNDIEAKRYYTLAAELGLVHQEE
jgi:hypothetical protein